MELNYQKDVRIDESALDLEWLDQAELAVKYGIEWAALKKKVAILEEKVKVTRSQLINKAIEDPKTHLGLDKTTVQAIEAFYRTDKKHKKLKQKLIEAQEELDLAEIAKNEIAFTRKSALENMTKLYIADYFAGPNVPRDLPKLRSEKESHSEAVKSQTKVKRKKNKE